MNGKEPSRKYWHFWYIGVLGFLVVQIIIFNWLTQYFS